MPGEFGHVISCGWTLFRWSRCPIYPLDMTRLEHGKIDITLTLWPINYGIYHLDMTLTW